MFKENRTIWRKVEGEAFHGKEGLSESGDVRKKLGDSANSFAEKMVLDAEVFGFSIEILESVGIPEEEANEIMEQDKPVVQAFLDVVEKIYEIYGSSIKLVVNPTYEHPMQVISLRNNVNGWRNVAGFPVFEDRGVLISFDELNSVFGAVVTGDAFQFRVFEEEEKIKDEEEKTVKYKDNHEIYMRYYEVMESIASEEIRTEWREAKEKGDLYAASKEVIVDSIDTLKRIVSKMGESVEDSVIGEKGNQYSITDGKAGLERVIEEVESTVLAEGVISDELLDSVKAFRQDLDDRLKSIELTVDEENGGFVTEDKIKEKAYLKNYRIYVNSLDVFFEDYNKAYDLYPWIEEAD